MRLIWRTTNRFTVRKAFVVPGATLKKMLRLTTEVSLSFNMESIIIIVERQLIFVCIKTTISSSKRQKCFFQIEKHPQKALKKYLK